MYVYAGEDEKEIKKRNNELDFETDPHRIQQRQRQIDFGKNTIGYQRYLEKYPVKRKRPRHLPNTPDVRKKCSKRAFDGQVRAWRRRLHEWDLPENGVEGTPVASGTISRDTEYGDVVNDELENNVGLQNSKLTSEHKRGGQNLGMPVREQKKMRVASHWTDVACKPSAINPLDVPEDLLVSYSDDEL